MRNFTKVILVLILLTIGFGIAHLSSKKSYTIVAPNWIRAENASFTVQATEVNCETFTISVLGFFASSIAEDVAKSPANYLQLYSKLQLEADYPIKFARLEESNAPFGFYANYQNETFSVMPHLVEDEKYHVTVTVNFSEFAEIPESVPFELELIPKECQ